MTRGLEWAQQRYLAVEPMGGQVIDWSAVSAHLDAQGWTILPKLVSANQCEAVAALYDLDQNFRSHIVMARHGFGRGQYKYFEGGEFVLTEQRPRMQSRVAVVPLRKGDAVVFAVNSRPVEGARGWYRVKLRHGVSVPRSGHRHTLGIIFHDAL